MSLPAILVCSFRGEWVSLELLYLVRLCWHVCVACLCWLVIIFLYFADVGDVGDAFFGVDVECYLSIYFDCFLSCFLMIYSFFRCDAASPKAVVLIGCHFSVFSSFEVFRWFILFFRSDAASPKATATGGTAAPSPFRPQSSPKAARGPVPDEATAFDVCCPIAEFMYSSICCFILFYFIFLKWYV